jgi:DNA-binding CsgD family transcriptional regulator/PAS domain-containing protein
MDFSDQRIDRLVDLIYDAATEPQPWCAVLTEIADLTGSQGGILFGQSLQASRVYFDYNGRLDEACNRAYQERHMRNLWSESMQPQPVGRIVLSDDVVPLASLRRTPFFDEVLRPQRVAHNAMIKLAGNDDFHAAFNLCRSVRQGPLGENGRRLLALLTPHMRRSFDLGLRLDGYHALQRAAYRVLDRLSTGVLLLDRRQRVLYANAAAQALDRAEESPLRLRGAAVTARSPSHAQRLAELICQALAGASAGSMSLPRPGDGGLLTILVSPVRGRDIGRFADARLPDAAVLLFIVDPLDRSVPLAWITDAYGLTSAEARVALAAASGLSIPAAADRLGISSNTVKTHLRRVYAKTGTSRQAELARVVASLGLVQSGDPQ